MNGKYDDLLSLPHPVSASHPQMPLIDRAAQFSPFAALTGYDSAVQETARVTDARLELDESEKERLNEQLCVAATSHFPVSITYFRPDQWKAGGSYLTVTGCIRRIDDCRRLIQLTDGIDLPIDDIFDVKST